MSKAFSFMAAGVAALTLACSPQAMAQANKIAIGYATATDFLPAFVAKENGCYAKQGLDVTLTRIAIASTIPAAIISGSLQIGMSTAPILLQSTEGGLSLQAVAGATRMVKSNPTISLVLRNSVKMASASDLKGKKIGVPGINSVADVMFRKWLANEGVKQSDLTFIETPFPQMSDLLKAGTLDGVLAAEPIRSLIVGAGNGHRAPVEYYVAVDPDTVLAFWISDSKWAEANKDVVAKFRSCLREGLQFIASEPARSKEIEKQYLGFNTPNYPTMTADIKPSDFDFFVRIGTEMGLVTSKIDVNKLVAP